MSGGFGSSFSRAKTRNRRKRAISPSIRRTWARTSSCGSSCEGEDMRTLHGRMSRLEAKRGTTPLSALSDAELEAEISWRRAALAAEAERIAALPGHLRPVPTAEDEAVTRRIAELEAGLAR